MSLARLLDQMRRDERGEPLPPVRWFGARLTLAAVFVALLCVAFGFWTLVLVELAWRLVT